MARDPEWPRALEEGLTYMNDRREKMLAWFASGLSCLYFAWSYVSLARYTKVFVNYFGYLGVEPPALTRFVIASHFWLYPALFFGAGAFVIAKEFIIHDKRISLLMTLVVALVAILAVDWIKNVFTLPLLDLVQKLR
jgi:hypothetical protein